MRDNSKLLITILLFLVIFLVIIFITPNNSGYLNVIEGYADNDTEEVDSSGSETTIHVNDQEILSSYSRTPHNQLNKPIIQINYHSSSSKNTNEDTTPPRAGGILSSEFTDQMSSSESKDDSVYNYGAPGTKSPTDSMGQVDQYAVEYKERPSVTGMFTETGPMGANIGAFEDLHDCNCVIINE